MNDAAHPVTAANPEHGQTDPNILWHHAVFCQLALPFTAPEGAWRREVDGSAITMDAPEDQAGPSGWCFRLLLMHVCDKAVRARSPLVEMEMDAAGLAAEMGLPATEPVLHELTEQLERMMTAKVTVMPERHVALAVFDARGQARRAAGAWRTRIRLNTRFHASLTENAVPLDRRIVGSLAAEALALDAHAWIRSLLQGRAADLPVTMPWAELTERFGAPGQEAAAFRSAFEDALRMVFAADFSISLAADDEGVTVGFAAPEAAAPEPPPAAVPAAPEPVPQPVPAPPVQDPAAQASPPPEPEPSASRGPLETVSLRQNLTGLPVVVWLRRAHGNEPLVIGVTRGSRLDQSQLTVLMLEPLIMQVSGGLYQEEFDRVSAWIMANRDLIDMVWEGEATSFEEIASRVRKVTQSASWR